jgi:hypothetical protein
MPLALGLAALAQAQDYPAKPVDQPDLQKRFPRPHQAG